MTVSDPIKRFYALDALRGFAALGAVLFHYRNFNGGRPLEQGFLFIHVYGWMMVDLFFCLSGFIFFWKYGQALYDKSIGFKKFAYLRFTRLYPLHFLTLVLVGVGQLLVYLSDGKYFIVEFMDLKHLLLNIFFISSWGFQNGGSFNGPIWSVSVEILLYGIFFICFSRLSSRNILWPPLLIFLGLYIHSSQFEIPLLNSNIGRGFISFFAGGLSYQIYRKAQSVPKKFHAAVIGLTGAVLVIFWAMIFILLYDPRLGERILYLWFYEIAIIGFPSIILFGAFLDTERVGVWIFKKLAFLGDISYSVYLIHFPIQIAFYLAAQQFPIDFHRIEIFLLFFAVTIGLATVTYKYYEIPCRRYLRSRFPVQ